MNSRRFTMSPLFSALLATLALGACSRHDEQAAGRQVDHAMARAEQKSDEARSDAGQALDRAQQAATRATDKAAVASNDAAITSSITTQLARDGRLDPAKIDVDTVQGRVVLRGAAPDEQAKERAKRIALAVNGVKGVDNYLSVNGKS